jgi:hypothetical protein
LEETEAEDLRFLVLGSGRETKYEDIAVCMHPGINSNTDSSMSGCTGEVRGATSALTAETSVKCVRSCYEKTPEGMKAAMRATEHLESRLKPRITLELLHNKHNSEIQL